MTRCDDDDDEDDDEDDDDDDDDDDDAEFIFILLPGSCTKEDIRKPGIVHNTYKPLRYLYRFDSLFQLLCHQEDFDHTTRIQHVTCLQILNQYRHTRC